MTRAPVITVIGKSARNPADPVPTQALRAAEEVGELLARRGAVVVTGGLSGVLVGVSRGA
jgi:predicted Rossmann-fold nucleotide-binding protein